MEEHNLKGTSFASDIVYCQVEGVRLLRDDMRWASCLSSSLKIVAVVILGCALAFGSWPDHISSDQVFVVSIRCLGALYLGLFAGCFSLAYYSILWNFVFYVVFPFSSTAASSFPTKQNSLQHRNCGRRAFADLQCISSLLSLHLRF